MAGSVAAVVHGFATLDPRVRIGGVVFNRVGSEGHAIQLREALAPLGIAVVGVLRRDDRLVWRDRHLGLVPVLEDRPRWSPPLDRLAAAIAERLRPRRGRGAGPLGAARSPPTTSPVPAPVRHRCGSGWPPGRRSRSRYTDTARRAGGRRRRASCRSTRSSTTALPDRCSPGSSSAAASPRSTPPRSPPTRPLLDDAAPAHRRRACRRGPSAAACCGCAARSTGARWSGVVPATARMTDRLTLGYRAAATTAPSPLGPAGTSSAGTSSTTRRSIPPATRWPRPAAAASAPAGFATPTLLAIFLHHHPGGDPSAVAAFLDACRRPTVTASEVDALLGPDALLVGVLDARASRSRCRRCRSAPRARCGRCTTTLTWRGAVADGRRRPRRCRSSPSSSGR